MRLPFVAARHKPDASAVIDCLRELRDGLRGRLSLSQALVRASAGPRSPWRSVAAEIESGRPPAEALQAAAAGAGSTEESLALLVLSVQARAGGDPVPLVGDLEARVRRREAERREARALTTQSRLSARAILLLTPGFLLLLFCADPSGTWSTMSLPSTRLAVAAGLALQALGGWWIARIVGAPDRGGRSGSRLSQVPVLRAVGALARGGAGRRDSIAGEVAFAADLVGLLLDAGMNPGQALQTAAPTLPGEFGDAMRRACSRARAGQAHLESLRDEASAACSQEGARFAAVFEAGERLGVPMASALRALAEEISDTNRARAAEATRAASLKVLIPLGVLILPAFVLACLVPLFLNGLRGLPL